MLLVIRWVHLMAAATWTGGLLVLAATVVVLRKEGVSRETLRAVARQFGRVSWVAMALAVATGLAQVHLTHLPWTYGPLHVKMGLVFLAILVAAGHTLTARKSSPAVRGALQGVIMLLSAAIFFAAVYL